LTQAHEQGGGRLRPGSELFYVAKAGLTHARSAWWLARSGGRPKAHAVRILFYHRISDDRDELAVSPRRFREQMRFLSEAGYSVVDVDEVGGLLARGELPGRAIGLCFDDGFLDVAEHALPVLSALGFRATVYVANEVIEGRATFGWYEKQPPVLDWEAIVRLDAAGTLRFGAHTATHPNLLTLDAASARREIVDSKRELEARLGRPVDSFCYPGGLYGERERRLVAEAGYATAVSCEPGANTPAVDPLELYRIQIDPRDRLLDFRAKVGGGHDSPPPLRSRYRNRRYGSGTGRPRSASSPR
jgi:peptidoglycan/xylan/chitin deacetylase (PgdA/CDA1 family)